MKLYSSNFPCEGEIKLLKEGDYWSLTIRKKSEVIDFGCGDYEDMIEFISEIDDFDDYFNYFRDNMKE